MKRAEIEAQARKPYADKITAISHHMNALTSCLADYALPALDYLAVKAMSASDRAEFKDRAAKVRALIAGAS